MDAISISLPPEIVEEITHRVAKALAARLDVHRTPEFLTTAQAAGSSSDAQTPTPSSWRCDAPAPRKGWLLTRIKSPSIR